MLELVCPAVLLVFDSTNLHNHFEHNSNLIIEKLII